MASRVTRIAGSRRERSRTGPTGRRRHRCCFIALIAQALDSFPSDPGRPAYDDDLHVDVLAVEHPPGLGRWADRADNAPSRRIEAIPPKLRSPSSKVQVLVTRTRSPGARLSSRCCSLTNPADTLCRRMPDSDRDDLYFAVTPYRPSFGRRLRKAGLTWSRRNRGMSRQ